MIGLFIQTSQNKNPSLAFKKQQKTQLQFQKKLTCSLPVESDYAYTTRVEPRLIGKNPTFSLLLQLINTF